MPLSVVINRLTSRVECFNGSEFAVEYPANIVLHPSKHLRNRHDGDGEIDFPTGNKRRDFRCEKEYELYLHRLSYSKWFYIQH